MAESDSEIKLLSPPTDAVSAIVFSPQAGSGGVQHLLVSSWDCTVRLYDLTSNSQKLSYKHAGPVLDCSFQDGSKCYSGGLCKTVKGFDINTAHESQLGQHEAPIRCVHYNSLCGVVVTGSWDTTVKFWDPRAPAPCQGTYSHPDKIYTLDSVGDKLVVGTAGRKVLIWDMRNMGSAQQKRDSSLKYQTRCIRCFPNGQGFVQSSIEGRVAVEFLDPSPEAQRKKYAFKCHRIKEQNVEKIYPVNAVAFHPYNTFATGGSDGFVNIWDGFSKKRLCQFRRLPTSITSLAFNADGTMLAIASSYMLEDGELTPPPEDSVYIRRVTDQEAKPK